MTSLGTVDAQSVEVLIRQLELDRKEAVARLRAADGELLAALLS
jgi:NACalpha-BTF3-like transcription factor